MKVVGFRALSALCLASLVTACSDGSFSVEDTPEEATTAAPSSGSPTTSKDADASTAAPGAPDGDAAPSSGSRCELSGDDITCTSHEFALKALVVPRKVVYEVPLGTPPAKGWPVVFFFQGSLFPAETAFNGNKSDLFGRYELVRTVKELLDHGYAVLAPNATGAGTTAWQTNVLPWSVAWDTSSDNAFLLSVFDAVKLGAFGPLDDSSLYAMGISSGGFMTSRMAVSYPGKFKALVVHSASYATCGAICSVPSPLPSDHPPTLFLHGEQDLVVSPSMMEEYRDELLAEHHEVRTVLDPNVGHAWLPEGPSEVLSWFTAHP